MVTKDFQIDNINFDGGNLSSDGGVILLMEYIRHIKLSEKLGKIPFHDDRRCPEYTDPEICYHEVIKNLFGYFNQSDQKVLKEDPLLSSYVSPCSQPTLSRFFLRASIETNYALQEMLTRMACNYINAHVDAPIIDADSTLVETYGAQEAASYIHHYGEVGYHPLVVNEFNSKLLLSAQLRTGAAYSSNGIINELMAVLEYLYNRENIRFRGDSAFYDTQLLSFLEKEKIKYYIRAKGFSALHRAVMEDVAEKNIDWWEYDSRKPYYGEIKYRIGTKDGKKRRIVYKMYTTGENGQMSFLPVIYCIVTNDETSTPYEAMHFYELRGASENFTKELKGGFDAGHLSHASFEANALEFLTSAIAYNVYHLFRNTVLSGEHRKMTIETFRTCFQKIAVKVVHHARKVKLSFSSAYKNRKAFMKYWNVVLQL